MSGVSLFKQPMRSILHPTDFSETSELAFAHALGIAVANQAALTILHVVTDLEEGVHWENYPHVRRTLERWGHLTPGSSQGDVSKKLGVKIKKVLGVDKNVTRSILRYMEEGHVFDLIVLATEEDAGIPNWIRHHIAVPVSQSSKIPTMFVRHGDAGCVSTETGAISLRNVLVPIDHKPDPAPVMEKIIWTMDKVGGHEASVTLLHVGPEDQFPKFELPDYGKYTWFEVTTSGNPATKIIEVAGEISADLIMMVTEGQHGLMDVLRGSTSQQVLRKGPCPMVTIPVES